MRTATTFLLVLTLLLAAGCRSTPLHILTAPLQPDEVVIGEASGKATGIMLFQLIPIGQNDRFVDAYSRALVSVPGATRLVDVTIQETWFWAWLLNGYRFQLTGTAVRAK